MSGFPMSSVVPVRVSPVALLCASLFSSSLPVWAAGVPTLSEVAVNASSADLVGVADSATEGTVTARQLVHRPLLRPAEVMESIPGLTVTQHSGDGKANQYFLRGFNLDHGSDFATWLDGMPVNNVSHAHGQGYMDLNFLIPELVHSLRYRKGVYAAEDGDLAVTGSARLTYAKEITPFASLTLGEHGYQRVLGAGSRRIGDPAGNQQLLGALEVAHNNGPWEQPEQLGKVNGVLRLSDGSARDGYALTAMAYRSQWTATEHVPERAILTGEIGRYGTLAPTDGGKTHRYSLSGEWHRSEGDTTTRSHAYWVNYGLNLFSSPSGGQDGQHEQADQRNILGGDWSRSWALNLGGHDTEFSVGGQLRQDRIQLGLYQTQDRQRLSTTRSDRITQTHAGLFAEAKTQWQPWLRSVLGVRYDRIEARVTPTGGEFNTSNGGQAQGQQVSPKVGLIWGPFDLLGPTKFYAQWGKGFHSNDMRGVTSRMNAKDGSALEPVQPLVLARGSEIGMRSQPLPGWHTSLSLWQMRMASELVFIGDEGVTEPKGSSRRQGIEWSHFYQPNDWLIIDADLAWSRARFDDAVNGGTQVPNAIPRSASLALTADRGATWFGGVRMRYIGAYALEETGEHKSTAFWTTSLKVGYRLDSATQIALDVLNVFDRKANDIEYWGSSCTPSEGAGCNGGAGNDGRLVHPLEPRTFRVTLRSQF